MIHLATIHHRSDAWVEMQTARLARHTAAPYRSYASLDGLDRDRSGAFDRAVELGVEMPPYEKLDRLGALMLADADDEDLIGFIHGDCFPIAEWTAPIEQMLARTPLVAVLRTENAGEPIPHPSFAVARAGFWRELAPTWAPGPRWSTGEVEVTDVGAELWQRLEREGIEWTPLRRSNAVDLHPLWFGVYGDLVYHHGAGFRRPVSRADVAGTRLWSKSRRWPAFPRKVYRRIRFAPIRRRSRRVMAELQGDGDALLERLSGRELRSPARSQQPSAQPPVGS